MAKKQEDTLGVGAPPVADNSVESLPLSLTPEQFKEFEDNEDFKHVLPVIKELMKLGVYRYSVRNGKELLIIVEGELRTPILEVLKDHDYFIEMRTVPQKITLVFGYEKTPDDE